MGEIFQVIKRGTVVEMNLAGATGHAAPIMRGDQWNTANQSTGGGSTISLESTVNSLAGDGVIHVRRENDGTFNSGMMSYNESMYWLARIGGTASELEKKLDPRIAKANKELSNAAGYCSGY